MQSHRDPNSVSGIAFLEVVCWLFVVAVFVFGCLLLLWLLFFVCLALRPVLFCLLVCGVCVLSRSLGPISAFTGPGPQLMFHCGSLLP